MDVANALNDRHGTDFTEADKTRFERVNQDILDDDKAEMLCNNPSDLVYDTFSDAFFQRAIRMFQRDNEMQNIVRTDADAREKATRHVFSGALRAARG